jgi:hypothetical protein
MKDLSHMKVKDRKKRLDKMFPNRQSNRLIMLEDPHYVVSLNQTIDDSKKQNNILKKEKYFFELVF